MAYGYGNGEPRGYGSPFESKKPSTTPLEDRNMERFGESIALRLNDPQINPMIKNHHDLRMRDRMDQISRQTMQQPQQPAFGFHSGGVIPSYNSGGHVQHYNTGGAVGNTDTVPAMLTPGEVVLNRQQQQALGNIMASGGRVQNGGMQGAAQTFQSIGVPGYAKGGKVAAQPANFSAPKFDFSNFKMPNMNLNLGFNKYKMPEGFKAPPPYKKPTTKPAAPPSPKEAIQEISTMIKFDPTNSDSVRVHQKKLNEAGYLDGSGKMLKEDGGFGPKTAMATIKMDKDMDSLSDKALTLEQGEGPLGMQTKANQGPPPLTKEQINEKILNGDPNYNVTDIIKAPSNKDQITGLSQEVLKGGSGKNVTDIVRAINEQKPPSPTEPKKDWGEKKEGLTQEEMADEIVKGNPNYNILDIVKAGKKPAVKHMAFDESLSTDEMAEQIKLGNTNFNVRDIVARANKDRLAKEEAEKSPFEKLFSGENMMGNMLGLFSKFSQMGQRRRPMIPRGMQFGFKGRLPGGVTREGGLSQEGGVVDAGGVTAGTTTQPTITQEASYTPGAVTQTAVPTYQSNLDQGSWSGGAGGPFGTGQSYDPVQSFITQGPQVDAFGNPTQPLTNISNQLVDTISGQVGSIGQLLGFGGSGG